MTKAETIKQHYITEFINSGMSEQEAEQKWEGISEFVDDNGWLNSKEWLGDFGNTKIFKELKDVKLECLNNYSGTGCYKFRLKSLDGLENNRGWTSILNEKDIPSADSHKLFEICVKGKNKGFLVDAEFIRKADSSIKITHYKKSEPSSDPIF